MKNILGVLIMFSISLSLVAKNCEEPISKDRFDLIYKSLTIKKNDQQRYQLVLAFATRECLSAEQMNSFLELFTDSNMKFAVVQDTYKLLFDSESKKLLLEDFTERQQHLITD